VLDQLQVKLTSTYLADGKRHGRRPASTAAMTTTSWSDESNKLGSDDHHQLSWSESNKLRMLSSPA